MTQRCAEKMREAIIDDLKQFQIHLLSPEYAATGPALHERVAIGMAIDRIQALPLPAEPPPEGSSDVVMVLLEAIRKNSENPTPTTMSDRQVLDWINGKVRAAIAELQQGRPPA